MLHTELRVATEHNIHAYPCSCVNCHGGMRKPIYVVREHHNAVGRDPFLTKSIIRGGPPEGYPSWGIWVDDMSFNDDRGNALHREHAPSSHSTNTLMSTVMEALDRGNALHREYAAEPDMDVEDIMDSDTM